MIHAHTHFSAASLTASTQIRKLKKRDHRIYVSNKQKRGKKHELDKLFTCKRTADGQAKKIGRQEHAHILHTDNYKYTHMHTHRKTHCGATAAAAANKTKNEKEKQSIQFAHKYSASQ